MVNGNHFQFDRKSLFNFLKTIYGFKNCNSFFGFKLFILASTFVGIHHCQVLEFVNSPNLLPNVPKFRYLVAEFQCWNLALIRHNQATSGDQILAKLARI